MVAEPRHTPLLTCWPPGPLLREKETLSLSEKCGRSGVGGSQTEKLNSDHGCVCVCVCVVREAEKWGDEWRGPRQTGWTAARPWHVMGQEQGESRGEPGKARQHEHTGSDRPKARLSIHDLNVGGRRCV